MKAVILAGGSGTRLWPASTTITPKQFLDIDGQGALLLQTLRRCAKLGVKDQSYVVTRDDYAAQVAAQLNAFNPTTINNIILEPQPRNTAPALLLAAKFLEEFGNAALDTLMLVLPSDHLIPENEKLVSYFALGQQLAKNGHIVTFGIVPDKPETGYGYIKARGDMLKSPGVEWVVRGLPVDSFREKPDFHTAQQYLEEGGYYWNAGIFALTIGTLYEELAKHYPPLAPYLVMDYRSLMDAFGQLPDISIDYAIMEKTQRAVVIPLDVDWSDVGSWDSVYEILPKDDNDNAMQGNVIASDTTGSLLVNRSCRPMAAVGMHDMIAIQTDDGLLMTPRGGSQGVREVTTALKKLSAISQSRIPAAV